FPGRLEKVVLSSSSRGDSTLRPHAFMNARMSRTGTGAVVIATYLRSPRINGKHWSANTFGETRCVQVLTLIPAVSVAGPAPVNPPRLRRRYRHRHSHSKVDLKLP